VKWGPGRHGPGNNLFVFIHDLDGNWVEVSAELEHVRRIADGHLAARTANLEYLGRRAASQLALSTYEFLHAVTIMKLMSFSFREAPPTACFKRVSSSISGRSIPNMVVRSRSFCSVEGSRAQVGRARQAAENLAVGRGVRAGHSESIENFMYRDQLCKPCEGDRAGIAEVPMIFTRFADSQVAHGASLVRPKVSSNLDFEGELAAVIGRPARHVSAKDALDHVAGYSASTTAAFETGRGIPSNSFPARIFREQADSVRGWSRPMRSPIPRHCI